MMRVARYRKDVVLINLSRSFPELKYKEIRKIARQFYKNLGQIAAETLWLGGRVRRKEKVFKKGIVQIENGQEINDAIGKSSVMVLNSHAGNWELIGVYMQKLCDESNGLFKENDVEDTINKRVTEMLQTEKDWWKINDDEYDEEWEGGKKDSNQK